MPKRTKPYPKFVVSIDESNTFAKRWCYIGDMKHKLMYITYITDKGQHIHVIKNIFEEHLIKQGFRRPTSTEKLLFEQE